MPAKQKSVPSDIRDKILQQSKARDQDLVSQIAFLESGLSSYRSETEFCNTYGISRNQLKKIREEKRGEIEDFKDKHRHGKYKIIEEVMARTDLAKLLREAAIRGEDEAVKKISGVMDTIEKAAPLSMIKKCLDMLGDMDDPTPQTQAPATIITVNNAVVEKAEELMRKKLQTKTFELENK